MESFQLLFEEKNDFYLKINKNRPPDLEEKKIKYISSIYQLEGLYYSLDNHNIFKRSDRYKHKIILAIIFGLLVLFNLFEIIFNIVMLTNKRKSEDFSDNQRFLTSLISLSNILIILILSTLTTTKLKIRSTVFY